MDYERLMSSSVRSLKPSGIRRFFDILENMHDPSAISLGIGEPDFVTPWHIREAGIYSLEQGFTKYTGNAGLKALRAETSNYLKRRFDLSYDPDGEIFITVGGSEAIDLCVRALVEAGDEVIVPVPSFVCYGPLVTMSSGTPVYVETKAENEFRLTARELREAITPRTKLLILPFPNNPTGAVMERKDLLAIEEVLRGTDIMILSDEIYSELSYGIHHTSPANIDGLKERTLVVNGFSKAFAMTGWRLGYVCGPKPLLRQMVKIHQYGIMSAPTTSQYAAIEALKNGDDDIEMMRESYDRRRKLMLKRLRDMGLECFEPKGAFYMFPSIKSTGMTSDEFCTRFLEEEKVAVIPGTAFGQGGEGFVRMCYAASVENIEAAMDRMKRFLERVRK
ncbi:MAG: aminotransferase class I/II-fold pyridoxal phosphate-dependent enzyme [Oscillospiraceae bacterium]|nr:aminotransferase class I/II-fold pyridoxal phosphate-dependent enzyme [Oscillospiraceae bacterium]